MCVCVCACVRVCVFSSTVKKTLLPWQILSLAHFLKENCDGDRSNDDLDTAFIGQAKEKLDLVYTSRIRVFGPAGQIALLTPPRYVLEMLLKFSAKAKHLCCVPRHLLGMAG